MSENEIKNLKKKCPECKLPPKEILKYAEVVSIIHQNGKIAGYVFGIKDPSKTN